MQKFGLTASEMARAKSLRQLGVSEEDLLIAEKLLREMPAPPVKGRSNSKAELVLGYDKARLDRKKVRESANMCMCWEHSERAARTC